MTIGTEQLTPGRKIFFCISSFETLAAFRRALFYSYLAVYLRFFLGLSVTETTISGALPMIANVAFQNLVWGRVSDKLQLRRTLIIIGELVAAVFTFLVWYVHTWPESKLIAGYIIIVGLSVVEVFWSMSNVGWSAMLSDLYPEDARAGLQGKLQSIGAAGRLAGVLAGGLLYNGAPFAYEGWGFDRGVLFFIAAGVMALSTIPMFFVPEGGVRVSRNTPARMPSYGSLRAGADRDPRLRKFLVFLLAMMFVFFGMNSVVMLKPQYLSLPEGFGVSSETLSYILNMGTGAIFLGGLMIKRMTRRLGDERMLFMGAVILVAYLLIYSSAERLPLIFAGDFLGGIAQVVLFATSYSYVSKLIPSEKRGKQFAMFNGTLFLSWGVPGTLLTGPLADWLISRGYGQVFSYRASFVAAAGLVAIGVIILLYCMRMNSTGKQTSDQS